MEKFKTPNVRFKAALQPLQKRFQEEKKALEKDCEAEQDKESYDEQDASCLLHLEPVHPTPAGNHI